MLGSAVRTLLKRKNSISLEAIAALRRRLLQSKIQIAVHSFVSSVYSYQTAHNPLQLSHFSRKRHNPATLLRQHLSPWDGTHYKDKLLKSIAIKLILKACFLSLQVCGSYRRMCEEALEHVWGKVRPEIQKRIVFLTFKLNMFTNQKTCQENVHRADVHRDDFLRRRGWTTFEARIRMLTASRRGVKESSAFCRRKWALRAIKALQQYVRRREWVRWRLDLTSVESDSLHSVQSSEEEEEQNDSPRHAANRSTAQETDSDSSRNNTPRSMASHREGRKNAVTLAELSTLMKKRRYKREGMLALQRKSKYTSPEEMNVMLLFTSKSCMIL